MLKRKRPVILRARGQSVDTDKSDEPKNSGPRLVSVGVAIESEKELISDGVKYFRVDNSNEILIQCWICEERTTLENFSDHLEGKHPENVMCPGVRCGGFSLRNSSTKFRRHLEEHHVQTPCPNGHNIDIRKYHNHIAKGCSTEKVLNIKHDSVTFIEENLKAQKCLSDRSCYYLNGEICVVDGINYLMREDDFSLFVDCNICELACGLAILGTHLIDEHKAKDQVSCLSPNCVTSTFDPHELQNHLLDKHGSLRCKDCNWLLTILEVRTHLKKFCPERRDLKESQAFNVSSKVPTVACPYCDKQCTYLNKHIRDVHQPKTRCPICFKSVGQSYLNEHMKIQHQGKEVPTKPCPLCGAEVQKVKNHLKYMHKLSKEKYEEIYEKHFGQSSSSSKSLEKKENHADIIIETKS